MHIQLKTCLRQLALLPILLATASGFAAGNEVHPLDAAIKKVVSNSEFNLKIHRGNTPSLVLNGDQDKFSRVKIEQHGDTVSISRAASGWNIGARIEIDITLPELAEAGLNGSGSGEIEGFSGNQFKLGVNGSGSAVLDAQYADTTISLNGSGSLSGSLHTMKTLHLSQSGSGSANLNGEADSAELKLSGSGSLEGSKLLINKLNARASGSGSIKIVAKESADVATSGSGSIHIYGEPAERKFKSSGSGKTFWH